MQLSKVSEKIRTKSIPSYQYLYNRQSWHTFPVRPLTALHNNHQKQQKFDRVMNLITCQNWKDVKFQHHEEINTTKKCQRFIDSYPRKECRIHRKDGSF